VTPNIKKKRLDSRSFIQLRFGDSKQVGRLESPKESIPEPRDIVPGKNGVHIHRDAGGTGEGCSWCGTCLRTGIRICLNCGAVLCAG